jgi:signal transduction histidine kinase/CheY-like chemotaxis protein
MQKKTNLTPAAAERRRRAEARLKEQPPETGWTGTDTEMQRLVHELQVHQIELEMQNEELQHTRDRMESLLEKYSDLYDFAPVGYLTLDREGTIQEANLTAASLLGIERSRLIQRRFGVYVSAPELPAFNAFLTKVFVSKAKEECDVRLQAEGKPPVDVQMRANFLGSGQTCRVTVTDITEHKRADEDRLILNKLESTGILAGGIAHDFNNLLTVILLDVELAQELVPPGGELTRLLEEAKNTVLTASGLTQQLITFARGGELVRKPTPLSEVIQESVRTALSGSRVRCEFSLAEDLWLVNADKGQIGQVIRNMVLNAREAMPEGGVVSIRAGNVVLGSHENPSLPPGDYIRVSITDQGGGITQDVLPKIFDPYFSTKEKGSQRGMGLGLTICHTVIKKHGGAITVDSEVGETTFHIHLPACRKLPGEEKASRPKALPQHGKILVMDDEEAVRKVVKRLLRRLGHAVELAEDGQQAVEVYRSAKNHGCPFDAVILDLTVRAGVGGQEAIQALLQIDPAVKAIVMTGYANNPVVLEPERHGFKGVLTKPFDGVSLQKILGRVMDNGG